MLMVQARLQTGILNSLIKDFLISGIKNLSSADIKNFQPMNANFDILSLVEYGSKTRNKRLAATEGHWMI